MDVNLRQRSYCLEDKKFQNYGFFRLSCSIIFCKLFSSCFDTKYTNSQSVRTKLIFQAIVEEPSSPQPIKEESSATFATEQPPSPTRSTTSSSSGSYDLEDTAIVQERFQTASLSGHTSEVELEREVNT